jgi:hypothetical protein
MKFNIFGFAGIITTNGAIFGRVSDKKDSEAEVIGFITTEGVVVPEGESESIVQAAANVVVQDVVDTSVEASVTA